MATNFARTRKAPSRSGALHYAFCPKCDSEYGGWRGMTQDLDAAQAQADEHNAEAHEEPSVAEAAAAKRAEEDAAWEAEGRRVAQEVIAGQVAAMEDHILDAFRNDLHRERRDLVNVYTGADRKTKIADLDLVIGAVEEEQAKRAGLASSADILASFAAL